MNDLYSVITDSDSVNVMFSGKFMRGDPGEGPGARAWAPAGIFPGRGGAQKICEGGPYKGLYFVR